MRDIDQLPVDDTPPAELDPLATSHGAHSVEVPREMAPYGPQAASHRRSQLETMDAAGTTVERALAFLEAQVGLAEYPPGSNINWITDWYFGWHAAWCAMTTSRALIEAGFGTPDQIDIAPLATTSAKGWAYCPYVESDFRDAGRWHRSDPVPGDLVLYDWDGDGWSDHIGMLKEVAGDGTLFVYEGNTDEGVLRLKHRSLTFVRGYARPPYAAATAPPPPVPEEDDMATPHILLSYGSGVVLWHSSGELLTLATDKQVKDFLALDAVVMDDLTDGQLIQLGARIDGPTDLPELAHLLRDRLAE